MAWSYRDVEELLAQRGITVDHVTVHRRVQIFTPEVIDAARHARHATEIGGSSTRPTSRSPAAAPTSTARVDQHGQVIDVLVAQRRDARAARAFFARPVRLPAEPPRRAPLRHRPQDDIEQWVNLWNDNPRPYVWTKTADQILESLAAYCQRINDSSHWELATRSSATLPCQ